MALHDDRARTGKMVGKVARRRGSAIRSKGESVIFCRNNNAHLVIAGCCLRLGRVLSNVSGQECTPLVEWRFERILKNLPAYRMKREKCEQDDRNGECRG
jgi:hypothetical protein